MNEDIYFDPRFRELISQIIESIITACSITAVDSNIEFNKGCQTVINLTSIIQEIQTQPSELLPERVKQILEQKPPEKNAIINFPASQMKSSEENQINPQANYMKTIKTSMETSMYASNKNFAINPRQANLLKYALSKIFPRDTIFWNKKISGQLFIAQVDDILIYLNESNYLFDSKMLTMNGWKVLECTTEDINFPRRLERRIRQLRRSPLPLILK